MFERLVFPELVLFGQHHKGCFDMVHAHEIKEGEIVIHQQISRRTPHYLPKEFLESEERHHTIKHESKQQERDPLSETEPHRHSG